MLKNINPILTGGLLSALADMGHGDDLVIVDANYPASSAGVPVIRMPNITATIIADAVLSLMPLDDFVDDPVIVMDAPGERPQIFDKFEKIIARHEKNPFKLTAVERFSFYRRAKQAFAIIQSGERRLYGNIMLKKGVIYPDD